MKKSCEFQWFHFTHQCQHFYDRNRNNRFKCLLIEIIQMGRHLKRVDKSNIEAGTSWIDPWLVTSLLQSFSCGNPSSVTDLLFFFLFIVTQIQRRGNCRQFVHDSWVFHFCVPRERVKQKKFICLQNVWKRRCLVLAECLTPADSDGGSR